MKEKESTGITVTSSLIRPSLADIESYVAEQDLTVDPEYFFNYYASTGWMMGRSPMKDWRAALLNWSKLSYEKNTLASSQKPYIALANDL